MFSDFDQIADDVRPLRDEEVTIIDGNLNILLNLIDFDELEDKLLHEGCITERQKKQMKSSQNNYSKIRELLEIVRRNSYEAFAGFVRCLKDTKQKHVAHIFEKGGGGLFERYPYINVTLFKIHIIFLKLYVDI